MSQNMARAARTSLPLSLLYVDQAMHRIRGAPPRVCGFALFLRNQRARFPARRSASQSISVFANTCHASAVFASRLRRMYAFSPNR